MDGEKAMIGTELGNTLNDLVAFYTTVLVVKHGKTHLVSDIKREKETFSRGVAFGLTLRGTAGQRKLEGNQKQIALVRVPLRQSGTA